MNKLSTINSNSNVCMPRWGMGFATAIFALLVLFLPGKAEASCSAKVYFSYSSSGGTVYFYDSVTAAYTPNLYYWKFGDGHDTRGRRPSHTYTKSGTYNVCFIIADTSGGCRDSFCSTVKVTVKAGAGCAADFSYSTGAKSLSVKDASKTASGATWTTWQWSWGDGTTDSGSAVKSHSYARDGYYTVCLKKTDYSGSSTVVCTDSICKYIYVPAKLCKASFHYSVSGSDVTLEVDSTSRSSGARYMWVYGDKTSSSYSGSYVNKHSYSALGSYYVCMYMHDSIGGCRDTTCQTIALKSSCSAAFTYNVSGHTVSFTSSSRKSGLKYSWKFGDGNTSTLPNPTHTYSSSLSKVLVTLVVRDSSGSCSDSVSMSVGLSSCSVKAGFSYGIAGSTVYFKNGSTGANAYEWHFGDGTGSTSSSPSHTYSGSGRYYVVLLAKDTAGGCHDTMGITITIGPRTFDLNGQVWLNGRNWADYGKVWLIQVDSTDTSLTAIDSTSFGVKDSGVYHFGGVKPGSYLVKAALTSSSSHYSDYIPTYHDSSLLWSGADNISITSSGAWANIYMKYGTNPGGPGFIGGKVSAGANKKGDPMGNVEVILYDGNMHPVAYTYSDANGTYGFSGLVLGTYIVYPEVLGKKSTPATVVLTSSVNSINNLNIEVGLKTVTTSLGSSIKTEEAGIIQLYPNPVSDVLNISLDNKASRRSSLEVYDATGRLMIQQNVELMTGKQQLSLNTNALPAGIYILNLTSGDGKLQQHYRFVKASE